MVHNRLDEIVIKLNESGQAIKSKNQLLVQLGMKSSNASVYVNGLKPISDAVMNKLVLKYGVNKRFLLEGELPVLSERNEKFGEQEVLQMGKIEELKIENQMLKELVENFKQSIADKNKIIHLLERQAC